MPPELALNGSSVDAESAGAVQGDDWSDIRRLYRKSITSNDSSIDKKLVEVVLNRARRVIRHPSRPRIQEIRDFERHPHHEINLEESLEFDPWLTTSKELKVEVSLEKASECVAMLDCSSSMSGDKHLLASIAVAVMLLEIPETSGLVTFSSDATVIKQLGKNPLIEETVLKFLKVRPRGFTNIGKGLETGLRQQKKKHIGLLASDGRTTEGEDPLAVAKRYDRLVVLHLHGSGSDLASSKEIAGHGHGFCLEVEKFEELPRKMYEALRILGRM